MSFGDVMIGRRMAFVLVMVLVALVLAPVTNGKMIGMNFSKVARSTNNPGNALLTPTDVAGAGDASMAGWYNNADFDTDATADYIDPDEFPAQNNLLDNNGQATTADLAINRRGRGLQGSFTLGRSGRWSSAREASTLTPTQKLYNSSLGVGGSRVTELEITEIPYAKYDVYVYLAYHTHNDNFRIQLFEGNEVAGATPILYMKDGIGWQPKNNLPTEYMEITSNDPDNRTATGSKGGYVHYRGLTSDDIAIDFWGDNQPNGIAGFQIVEVPEPASLVLIGVGALMMARRRA